MRKIIETSLLVVMIVSAFTVGFTVDQLFFYRSDHPSSDEYYCQYLEPYNSSLINITIVAGPFNNTVGDGVSTTVSPYNITTILHNCIKIG